MSAIRIGSIGVVCVVVMSSISPPARADVCPNCFGTRKMIKNFQYVTCSTCGGTGSVDNGIPTPSVPPIPRPDQDLVGRIERARHDAENLHNRFNDMQHRYYSLVEGVNQAERLMNPNDELSFREAYRQLQQCGTIRTNRNEVVDRLRRGLGVLIPAKEFDHFEQIQLARAVAASVATANPGPAAQYLGQFLAESEQAFVQNLQGAPPQVRDQIMREFQDLLLRAVDTAIREHRPIRVNFYGFDVEIGLATFSYWIAVRADRPEIHRTGDFYGIPIYRLDTHPVNRDIALPNTFLPYLRIQARLGVR